MPLEQQRAIEVIVMALQNKSPSDSFVSLQVVNGESDVNGFLKINSKLMNFEVSQNGVDPLVVVKLLSKLWQNKLNLWKRDRFL